MASINYVRTGWGGGQKSESTWEGWNGEGPQVLFKCTFAATATNLKGRSSATGLLKVMDEILFAPLQPRTRRLENTQLCELVLWGLCNWLRRRHPCSLVTAATRPCSPGLINYCGR